METGDSQSKESLDQKLSQQMTTHYARWDGSSEPIKKVYDPSLIAGRPENLYQLTLRLSLIMDTLEQASDSLRQAASHLLKLSRVMAVTSKTFREVHFDCIE